MTEYEFHDFLTNAQMAAAQSSMDVVTVFFAFVVCTYVVGSRLRRAEAIALCVLYSIFLVMPALSVRGTLLRIQGIVQEYPDYALQTPMADAAGILSLVNPGVLLIAWLISILYLISERRKPAD